MKCSKCKDATSLRVKSSRYKKGIFIRSRECINCGYKITTAEIPYELYDGLVSYAEVIKRINSLLI
jgi:transcriptional regulator NrdR family protein